MFHALAAGFELATLVPEGDAELEGFGGEVLGFEAARFAELLPHGLFQLIHDGFDQPPPQPPVLQPVAEMSEVQIISVARQVERDSEIRMADILIDGPRSPAAHSRAKWPFRVAKLIVG